MIMHPFCPGGAALHRHAARALACLLLLALAGCEREDAPAASGDAGAAPLVAFDTTTVRIETGADTFHLSVEVAETESQRSYGLMDRESLQEDAGMLFVYSEPQDSTAGFWMYRTRVPLDIAFLDDQGRIVSILSMEPCPSPYPQVCRTYSPGTPYAAALEVNRGYFARRGITPGDRVVAAPAD